jgi:hypothetical protein
MVCLGLTAAGLITLIILNPTHFTSVDSGYYLQSAANLIGGRGYVVEEDGRWVWNGTFPIGYPALIAAGAGFSGLSVLWASKLINIMVVVLSAGLWLRRVGPERTLWLLSIWWMGGFLRILAYTWSETLFLVLLAEWVWAIERVPAIAYVTSGYVVSGVEFGVVFSTLRWGLRSWSHGSSIRSYLPIPEQDRVFTGYSGQA